MKKTFFLKLIVYFQMFILLTCNTNSTVQFTLVPTISSNPNPAAPLGAILTFQTNIPVNTKITLNNGLYSQTLFYGTERNCVDGLPIVGMKPNTNYKLTVQISDPQSDANLTLDVLEYKTPALPTGPLEFPQIQVKKSIVNRMEPGLTLFNPRLRIPASVMPPQQARRLNETFGMLVAVNAEGDVVWYFRGNSRISDFEQMSNGNILYLTQDYTAVEIDVLGNEITKWYATGRPDGPIEGAVPVETLTFHHDIEELPNGNFLVLGTDRRLLKDYYTSEWDIDAPRKDQLAMGDEIVEFQRDGKVVWKWNAWDYLDPFRFSYQALTGYWVRRGWPETMDWSHCNGLEYVKEDDSILLNSRYMSAVFNIDRKTGDINWIAGEHSGWSEELEAKLLEPINFDRWFWHQHAPKLTPNGTLLLFDNGNFQTRPFDKPLQIAKTFSRAVEYKIDAENKTIKKVWSSEISTDPSVVSFAMGSVHRMPKTQNILTGWGLLLPTDQLEEIEWTGAGRTTTWSRVREYTHSSPPEVVWDVNLISQDSSIKVGWTTFGARRVEKLVP